MPPCNSEGNSATAKPFALRPLLFALIGIALFATARAQNCDTMYIFRNNNYVMDVRTDQVDTMAFALSSDTVLTVYKQGGKKLVIDISDIDSITFNLPSTYIRDIEGNIYPTVTLGTQTWMAANLKTVTYNDGTPIKNLTDKTEWVNTVETEVAAYRWYNDDISYRDSCYGSMYNWYTVATEKLCPSGWHVPSDKEWQTLELYLAANGYNYDGTVYNGSNLVEARKKIAKSLAATYSWVPYKATGAPGDKDYMGMQNKTRFNVVAAGMVDQDSELINKLCYIWSSTPASCYGAAYSRCITSGDANLIRYEGGFAKHRGVSVRCVKDSE